MTAVSPMVLLLIGTALVVAVIAVMVARGSLPGGIELPERQRRGTRSRRRRRRRGPLASEESVVDDDPGSKT